MFTGFGIKKTCNLLNRRQELREVVDRLQGEKQQLLKEQQQQAQQHEEMKRSPGENDLKGKKGPKSPKFLNDLVYF